MAMGVLLVEEFLSPPQIHRMTVLAWLALFLSWGSLGLETATVVVSRLSKTAIQAGYSGEKRALGGRPLMASQSNVHICAYV